MFSRHKWPTFEGILMIADFAQLGKIVYFPVLIMIISVFSFAFFTADNPISLSSPGNQITGNMVKVTGMVGR